MFKIECDVTHWYFPICFNYTTVGNDHRPWTLQIGFYVLILSFALIKTVDS